MQNPDLDDIRMVLRCLLIAVACLWFLRLMDAFTREPRQRPRQRVLVLHVNHTKEGAEAPSPNSPDLTAAD